jgi:hypothetical protein
MMYVEFLLQLAVYEKKLEKTEFFVSLQDILDPSMCCRLVEQIKNVWNAAWGGLTEHRPVSFAAASLQQSDLNFFEQYLSPSCLVVIIVSCCDFERGLGGLVFAAENKTGL